MKSQMVIITHVENSAVTEGFIPAALKLGYDLVVITDHKLAYKHHFSMVEKGPKQILECDVFNPLAIIDLLDGHAFKPSVVFSNSDHLQACTALVAEYFSCPGKNWKTCYKSKNKAQMREELRRLQLPSIWSEMCFAGDPLPDNIPYPVIAKPREGVSSLDVALCQNEAELMNYHKNFTNKKMPILMESYIEGELFTLETLGDGKQVIVVGGFDVSLSALPNFIETRAIWNGEKSHLYAQQALEQIKRFGADFGVCHSEFIATASGPVLVEINYRSIGDKREFLLNELLSFDWFETILQLHAGKPLDTLDTQTPYALIQYFPHTKNGHLISRSESFIDDQVDTKVSYQALKNLGDRLTVSHSNKDYLGVLTVIGQSKHTIEQAACSVAKTISWEIS